jgi:hypothetical protein
MYRLAKIALCAALFLGLCGQAKAITYPTNLAPYLPANNVVAIVLVPGAGNASTDVYQVVATGQQFAVVKGTPLATVQKQANLSSAWSKFCAFMGSQMTSNMTYRVQATRWFYQVIAPLYN